MVGKDWELIYKEKGEVQKEVLPKVKKAVDLFRKRRFRRILDLACGTGRHTIYLAMEKFSVYATDVSKKGIEITKKKAKRYGLKDIKFKVHDMKKIPFPENFFDGILCVWSMGHGTLGENIKIINEIHRVLRPGGIVVTDFMSTKDATYGKGEEIEKNTFIGGMEGEEDVLHRYFTKQELKQLFLKFSEAKIGAAKFFFYDEKAKKHRINAYNVQAVK